MKNWHYMLRSLRMANALSSQRVMSTTPAAKQIRSLYDRLSDVETAPSTQQCNIVTDVVQTWAKTAPKQPALRCVYRETERVLSLSYQDLLQKSDEIATLATQLGLIPGDRVAIMLGQNPEWWFLLAGLLQQGIVVVPCPGLLTPKDLAYRFNYLNIKAVVTIPAWQAKVDAIKHKTPSLMHCLTIGPTDAHWLSLQTAWQQKQRILTLTTNTRASDPCVILCTSGTTGQPKGALHVHRYPFMHFPTGHDWMATRVGHRVYNASDTGWGFTVWTTFGAWLTGAEIVIAPTSPNHRFDPVEMMRFLQDQKITVFCAAPTVLRRLAATPEFPQTLFNDLQRIVAVGEPLDKTVYQLFVDKGIDVRLGYGQAETTLVAACVDNYPNQAFNAMGQPLPQYAGKLCVLDDNLHTVRAGEFGQLAIDLRQGRPPGLMQGYVDAEDAMQKAFQSHYYLSGDGVRLDKQGAYHFFGRVNDNINSHGYTIGSTEVEEAGMSHPAVAKIAVVGVPESAGSPYDIVKAFILLKEGETGSDQLVAAIQAHIKTETAPYKYPRQIEFLSLEEWSCYETPSGKIRRAGLREREKERLAASPEHPSAKAITNRLFP